VASKNLYLRSLADKGETGSPENLRLRSDADKQPAPLAKATQYLAGHDLPEFPYEMDLQSNKLPCPPPY